MAKKKKVDNPEINVKNEVSENVNYVQVIDETGSNVGSVSYATTEAIFNTESYSTTGTIYSSVDASYLDVIDMKELMAYDEACRMICGHYDREMKLNELESRNYTKEQIVYNREQYVKFVNIHNKLRETIENKLEKLAKNENW